MSYLTAEQKKTFKPLINGFATLVIVLVMVSLTCNYVIKSYPGYLEWLKGLADFVILLGAIVAGLVIADRNKLVK
jgi:uncharacterized integral membrane protein